MQTLFFAGGGRLLRYLDLIYLVEQQARIGFDALPGLAQLEALGRIDRFLRASYSIEFATDEVHEEIRFFKSHRYNLLSEWRPHLTVKNHYAYLDWPGKNYFLEVHKNRAIFGA